MLNARLVKFARGTETIAGFLALPAQPGPHRAIIAIHEWWGLTAWVKQQALNLAANAYVVLALDLYQGNVATTPSQARKLKRDLPNERAIRAMIGALDYLACRSDVDPQHIGTLGWSMGGALALQLAIREPRLAACVVNYGSLPTKLAELRKINVRMLGIFASLDRSIPTAKVRVFAKRMKALNKPVEIIIYKGAGHAFENSTNKRGYRPQAAADAWLRTLVFLDQSL